MNIGDSLMTYDRFLAINQRAQNRIDRQKIADQGIGNRTESFFIGTSDILQKEQELTV